jgi:hypothetical protein
MDPLSRAPVVVLGPVRRGPEPLQRPPTHDVHGASERRRRRVLRGVPSRRGDAGLLDGGPARTRLAPRRRPDESRCPLSGDGRWAGDQDFATTGWDEPTCRARDGTGCPRRRSRIFLDRIIGLGTPPRKSMRKLGIAAGLGRIAPRLRLVRSFAGCHPQSRSPGDGVLSLRDHSGTASDEEPARLVLKCVSGAAAAFTRGVPGWPSLDHEDP